MNPILRGVTALPGVLFAIQGIQWVLIPATAAEGLGMPLLEGAGRSTQMGDMAAFFLGISVMILVGVIKLEAQWLRAAALFMAGAAVFRTLSWAFHGADFTAAFIGVEVVVGALLFYASTQIRTESSSDARPG